MITPDQTSMSALIAVIKDLQDSQKEIKDQLKEMKDERKGDAEMRSKNFNWMMRSQKQWIVCTMKVIRNRKLTHPQVNQRE